MDCFLNKKSYKIFCCIMQIFLNNISVSGIVSRWIGDGMPPYDKDLIKRFSESFDATIDTMINLCEANN